MSILVNRETKVICQGITGTQGTFHTEQAIAYGTRMVGGVTPGRGGSIHLGLPVFDTVAAASRRDRRRCLGDLCPAALCRRRHPRGGRRRDPAGRLHHRGHSGDGHGQGQASPSKARRPGSSGRTAPASSRPDACKIGIMPGHIFKKGSVGIVSRSGTLTYEAVKQTSDTGLGQSTAVGIGGDPVKGTEFIDVLELFLADPETRSIVMIGEIGGSAEEEAADFLRLSKVKKPTVGFIAGRTAPPGRRMGHAGAIISGGRGGAENKIEAMRRANVTIADSPAALGTTLARLLTG